MSQPGSFNPYQSPLSNPYGEAGSLHNGGKPRKGPPVYSLVMAGLDLAFSCMRVIFVVLSTFVWIAALDPNNELAKAPIMWTVPLEVITGGAMVLFGVIAAFGIFFRARWAHWVGYAKVFSALAALVVTGIQLPYFVGNAPPGSPEATAAYAVGGIIIFIRLGLAIAYAAGVYQYHGWVNAEEER